MSCDYSAFMYHIAKFEEPNIEFIWALICEQPMDFLSHAVKAMLDINVDEKHYHRVIACCLNFLGILQTVNRDKIIKLIHSLPPDVLENLKQGIIRGIGSDYENTQRMCASCIARLAEVEFQRKQWKEIITDMTSKIMGSDPPLVKYGCVLTLTELGNAKLISWTLSNYTDLAALITDSLFWLLQSEVGLKELIIISRCMISNIRSVCYTISERQLENFFFDFCFRLVYFVFKEQDENDSQANLSMAIDLIAQGFSEMYNAGDSGCDLSTKIQEMAFGDDKSQTMFIFRVILMLAKIENSFDRERKRCIQQRIRPSHEEIWFIRSLGASYLERCLQLMLTVSEADYVDEDTIFYLARNVLKEFFLIETEIVLEFIWSKIDALYNGSWTEKVCYVNLLSIILTGPAGDFRVKLIRGSMDNVLSLLKIDNIYLQRTVFGYLMKTIKHDSFLLNDSNIKYSFYELAKQTSEAHPSIAILGADFMSSIFTAVLSINISFSQSDASQFENCLCKYLEREDIFENDLLQSACAAFQSFLKLNSVDFDVADPILERAASLLRKGIGTNVHGSDPTPYIVNLVIAIINRQMSKIRENRSALQLIINILQGTKDAIYECLVNNIKSTISAYIPEFAKENIGPISTFYKEMLEIDNNEILQTCCQGICIFITAVNEQLTGENCEALYQNIYRQIDNENLHPESHIELMHALTTIMEFNSFAWTNFHSEVLDCIKFMCSIQVDNPIEENKDSYALLFRRLFEGCTSLITASVKTNSLDQFAIARKSIDGLLKGVNKSGVIGDDSNLINAILQFFLKVVAQLPREFSITLHSTAFNVLMESINSLGNPNQRMQYRMIKQLVKSNC